MIAKLLDQATTAADRREIAVTKEEFLIGRGSDCDLRLGSSAVSRHHCMLRFHKGEVTLVELGSANGTFVNGQRIRSQATIENGAEIGIGEFRFVLQLMGRSGIDWGTGPDSISGLQTQRLKDMWPEGHEPMPKKDESHPPGEAGG